MEYKLTDKKLHEEGDQKDLIIEKHGFVPTFTLRQVEENIAYLKKHIKEITAKRDYERAKATNVETHHPFVKDIPKFDRLAVHMYQEALSMADACDKKLEELNAQLDEDNAELNAVCEQIPEFAEKEAEAIPSPFTPGVAEAPETPSVENEIKNDDQENPKN